MSNVQNDNEVIINKASNELHVNLIFFFTPTVFRLNHLPPGTDSWLYGFHLLGKTSANLT